MEIFKVKMSVEHNLTVETGKDLFYQCFEGGCDKLLGVRDNSP